MKQNTNSVPIKQHLYQIYPDIPRYAADPSQSDVIKIYDSIMLRFQGYYGKQPQYFVRSPTYINLFGDIHEYVAMSTIGFSSLQSFIIAVAPSSSKQIRINNYQNAVYGQQSYSTNPSQWKFNKQASDDYTNVIIAVLKTSLGGNKNYTGGIGADILIYSDMILDDSISWRQSLISSMHVSLLLAIMKQTNFTFQQIQSIVKRVKKLFGKELSTTTCLVHSQYGHLSLQRIQFNTDLTQQKRYHNQLLQFPQQLAIVIAHSMTPEPKMMVQGKRFNLRRCQLLLGIQLIKSELGINSSIKSIKQLQENLKCDLKQLQDTLDQYVPKDPLTTEQIEKLTQRNLIDLLKQVHYANNVIDQNHIFQPYNRFKFFLQEEKIIQQLTEKLQNAKKEKQTQHKSSEIIVQCLKESAHNAQKLLNKQSQQICQLLKCIEGLYLGYKIVGNGWGGNLAIVCYKDKANAIVNTLMKEFYLNQENKILLGDDIEMYVRIVGQPCNGLAILNPQSQIWY